MKIALIGSAPSSVQLGPFYDQSFTAFLGAKPPPSFPPSDVIDESWEIWGVSPGAFAYVPRADRWFECHRWEPGKPWLPESYCRFLMDFGGPVYTGGPVPEITNHVVYPIERVEAEFSAYFLHSSLSLMMAMAILEIEQQRSERASYTRMIQATPPELWAMWPFQHTREQLEAPEDDVIGLWGVDMAATEEYGDQRSGCHFFILEALRRGIAVYVPPESCLLRPRPIYGISEWSHDYIKATTRAREINARTEQATKQLQEATEARLVSLGEQSALSYWINTFMSPYGLPAGQRITMDPGTGLGGGFTVKRPIEAHLATMGPVDTAAPETTANNLYDLVVREYDRQFMAGKITTQTLAKRIGQTPEQVGRWLKSREGWTISVASDLCLGMGCEPIVSAAPLVEGVKYVAPHTLNACPDSTGTGNRKAPKKAKRAR